MKNNDSNREKIVECAIQIIKEEGIRSVNVTRIVNTCKISKTTFYKHFSSSKDLVLNIKEEFNIDNVDDEAFYSMRQMIIQKAIEVFSTNAFHAIEMDTIAKAAGIKRTSIYNYFSSKEELLEASLKNELENRKKFNEFVKSDPFDSIIFIKKILGYGVRFSTNKYNNLILKNGLYYSSVNEKIKKVWDDIYLCSLEIIEEFIKRGKKEGVFKEDVETETISKLILSCWFGLSVTIPEQYNELGNEFIEMMIMPTIINITK